jgi:hypothetical protein
VGIGAVILYWLLGPSVADLTGRGVTPTGSGQAVALQIGAVNLSVPQNYIATRDARGGGTVEEVALVALWPAMPGFSEAERDAFSDHGPESRVVRILLSPAVQIPGERERVEAAFVPQLDGDASEEGGFTVRRFAADSGYAGRRLFVWDRDGVYAAFVCADGTATFTADSCMRTIDPVFGLSVAYTFRRERLGDFQDIDAKVRTLLQTFAAR